MSKIVQIIEAVSPLVTKLLDLFRQKREPSEPTAHPASVRQAVAAGEAQRQASRQKFQLVSTDPELKLYLAARNADGDTRLSRLQQISDEEWRVTFSEMVKATEFTFIGRKPEGLVDGIEVDGIAQMVGSVSWELLQAPRLESMLPLGSRFTLRGNLK